MMTQAFLTTTNVDQMKLTFNDVYCDAEVDRVDTIIQMGDGAVDSCTLVPHDTGGKEKNENENLIKKSADKQRRKPRRVRTKSARQAQGPYEGASAERCRTRDLKARGRAAATRRARAPDNTTQFLMGDMDTADTSFHLDTADLDNEDNCENNFAKREFSKEYEKMAINKQKLPISKLIEEYFSLETEVRDLEKKYDEMTAQEQLKARLGAVDYEWEKGEIAMEPEVAEKIRIFHEEIAKIRDENRLLEEENLRYRSESRTYVDSESSSSSDESSSEESDSSSDSDTDTDSSSSEDEDEEEADIACSGEPLRPLQAEEPSVTSADSSSAPGSGGTEARHRDDTGYESGGSSGDTARVTSTTLRK